MKHIKAKIIKLEERMKPKLEEEEKRKQEEKSDQELFYLTNLAMQELHPEHPWSKLPEKEKRDIWSRRARNVSESRLTEEEKEMIGFVYDVMIRLLREEKESRAEGNN